MDILYTTYYFFSSWLLQRLQEIYNFVSCSEKAADTSNESGNEVTAGTNESGNGVTNESGNGVTQIQIKMQSTWLKGVHVTFQGSYEGHLLVHAFFF